MIPFETRQKAAEWKEEQRAGLCSVLLIVELTEQEEEEEIYDAEYEEEKDTYADELPERDYYCGESPDY